MPRALPHKTITVTRKWLEDFGACERGIRDVAPLLPLTISTDPEANTDAAIALVDAGCGWRVLGWFIAYAFDKIADYGVSYYAGRTCPDSDYRFTSRGQCVGSGTGSGDPMLVAQWLAHAADYIDRAARKRRR